MLPRVEHHLAELRSADAGAVRERAGEASDLDPALAARAPHRTAYRGLEVLAVYVEARRRLLFERFRDFWGEQERAGTWERLESAAERTLEDARVRREARERAALAAEELARGRARRARGRRARQARGGAAPARPAGGGPVRLAPRRDRAAGRAMKAGFTGGISAAIAIVALALTPPGAGAGLVVEGDPGVGDPFFPHSGNGGYQVASYDLRLNYRPRSDRLRARARIEATVETSGDPLGRFDLDYRGPAIKALEVDGAPADYERQGQELIITPASAPGRRIRLHGRCPLRRQAEAGHRSRWLEEGWTNTD